MPATVVGVEELPALVDQELEPTDWLEVTQERIDAFAACTDDPQWIHVDPVRAASGPFGSTVAHGFLTLSLIVRFFEEALRVEDLAVGINYGLDRVRFPAPVPVGSRIRARFRIDEVAPVEAGFQARVHAEIEREGHEKPVCVADALFRFLRAAR